MGIFNHISDKKKIANQIEDCLSSGGEVLDLSNLDMTELPSEIAGFENLTELNLSYNQLQSLPDWIGNLRKLKKLNLCGNRIGSIPDSIGALKQLMSIDIGLNIFWEIPACLKQLTSLEHIDLESLSLRYDERTLPDWIGDFTALKYLNLRHCGLTSLPDPMKNLVNLRTLYLGANCLPALPEWLGFFTLLEELDISANELYVVPEFIGNLKNLRALDLGHSGKWETEIRNSSVCYLDEQINELDRLPAFLTGLPRLVRLDLGNTKLKSLPEFLSTLRLESLKLGNNELTKIPEWLGSMTSLRELDLSENLNLKSLPAVLTGYAIWKALTYPQRVSAKSPNASVNIKS